MFGTRTASCGLPPSLFPLRWPHFVCLTSPVCLTDAVSVSRSCSSVCLHFQVELTHLSACRDALWGLDLHGRVSIRHLSPSCPTGLHWTPLDLSQLGTYLDVQRRGSWCLEVM